MSKFRGALIGCGNVSDFHLRAWQRIPDVAIVALCDTSLDRAETQARKYAGGARCYSSAEAMLNEERVDFIDILSPPSMHEEHCLLAKDAGAHIICQKPLCDDLEDAVKLVDAFQDYEKTFIVHENHRYRPWFRQLRELHESGFFGHIKYIRLEQHDPHPPAEEYKLRSARGVMLEYGVHLVDMMRALVGEPQQVAASLDAINSSVQGDSLAVAVYQCSGATVIIDIAWKAAQPARGGMIVEGEGGAAVYEGTLTRGETSHFRVFEKGRVVIDQERYPVDDFGESFYLLQREFINSVSGGTLPPQSAKDNLRSLRATLAAYESAAAGCSVAIDLQRHL